MNQNDIPADLKKTLVEALQRLSLYVHEQSGMSHVIIDIRHVSDCLARDSQTQLAAGAGGARVVRADQKPGESPKNPEELVTELIKKAMEQARKNN